MALDKGGAEAQGSRMSDLAVFLLSLMGGVWGTIAGMFVFHHKTQKEFQAVTFLIMLLNLGIVYRLLA